MGIIKENAPSGVKENPQNIARRNPGTSLGPGLVGGAKFLPQLKTVNFPKPRESEWSQRSSAAKKLRYE
jgi:hypothetical protein